MEVFSNIVLNLQTPAYTTVYSPQGQTLSRFIHVQLMDGSAPWTVPAGTLMTVRYLKPDGTFGMYDTNENNESAYTISGSTVDVELVSQMLTVAGNVAAQLDFYNAAGQHLSTFSFRVAVEESPITDGEIESSDYFNVLTATLAEAQQIWLQVKSAYGAPRTANTAAAMTDHSLIYVYTGTTTSALTKGHWYFWNGSAWTDGGVYNSTAFTTDTTLTIAGAAADAKATGNVRNALTDTFSPLSFSPAWTNGYFALANGAAASSSKYRRTSELWSGACYRSAIEIDDSTYEFVLTFYDSTGTTSGTGYLGHSSYNQGVIYIPDTAALFGISVRRVDGATLASADYSAISAALHAFTATDTTLSLKEKAADARVTGLAISATDSGTNKALNFFGYDNNLLTWEQGGINASDGTDLGSTTVIRTVGYFDVTDIYNFDVEIPSGFRFRIYRYDDNGVFKSASSNYTATKTSINTRSSQGTKYRFILADNSASPRSIYPQEGPLLSLRAYQNTNSLLKLASPSTQYIDTTVPLQKVAGVTKFPGNLFDPTNALNNYYIVYNTGERDSLTGYYATGYIPVVGGTTYKANHGRNLAWYDSSYVFISGVQGTSIQTGITAPASAAYIRFSISKSSDTNDLFDVYFAAEADYDPVVKIPGLVAEPIPWCYGKKIAWLGDSIVQDYDFDNVVANEFGMTLIDKGINGATIAYNSSGTRSNVELNELDTLIASAATVDMIAVSAGTNDFQYTYTDFGNINLLKTGTYDNTTFYGALAKLCDKLIANYPKKLIFFTTPIKRAQPFAGSSTATNPFSENGNNKTLMDYCDAIKEVCGYYSIPVLDLNRESLLNPHIAAQQDMFDAELTHPNDAGRKIMARRVCGWLTQLGYNVT